MARGEINQIRERDTSWRQGASRIVFGYATSAGRAFDIAVIALIVLSVTAVMLNSVPSIHARARTVLEASEWAFTILFSIEYLLRLVVSARPLVYARSFYGLIDLVGVLPTYIALAVPAGHYLALIRLLRVLRIFRILRLTRYVGEATALRRALLASRRKILVFSFTLVTLVILFGALMYLIEGGRDGFDSIPRGVYWAIVTLSTVGYGDITPHTAAGQTLAALVMLLGYSIIAVPAGIVGVEIMRASHTPSNLSCPGCGADQHESDAHFCRLCGTELTR